jgi:hypothetical protein
MRKAISHRFTNDFMACYAMTRWFQRLDNSLKWSHGCRLANSTLQIQPIQLPNPWNLELSIHPCFALLADDPETRRSSQGYLIKLFNGPIAWQASKQKTVVTSTTEAELLSLSHTAKEVLALSRLFEQITFDPEEQPVIKCDNLQTVGIVTKERFPAATKLRHVDTHQFWLRQEVASGKVLVQWIPTREMAADGLTKAKG